MDASDIIGVLYVLGSLILSIEFGVFVHEYHVFMKDADCFLVFSKKSMIMVMVVGILLIISGWIYSIYLLLDEDGTLSDILSLSSHIFWHLGRIFIYCFLINILYFDFSRTRHGISTESMIVLVILLFIYIIVGIIVLIQVLWDEIIFALVSLVIDFILSGILLVTFVIKLRNSVRDIRNQFGDQIRITGRDFSVNDEHSYTELVNSKCELDEDIDSRQEFEDQRFAISKNGSKIIILSIIMIILSQMEYVTVFMYYISIFGVDNIECCPSILSVCFNISGLIYLILVPFLLFLQFEFMEKYYKCCCNRLDIHLRNKITNKINKQTIIPE